MKHIELNTKSKTYKVLDDGFLYMHGTYTEIAYEANCITLHRDNGRIEFPTNIFIIEYTG